MQVRSERDDYVLSDQIENLDYFVGHDPKAAEAFFGNAPPHRPSSTSYFSTIEFLCWRFQSTLGPYARICSSKLTFVIDRYWRIVLKKSFLTDGRIFLGPLVRCSCGDVGPHRFTQKRPQTAVSALQSVAAAQTTKNQHSRDFPGRSIFDFCNMG